MAKRPSDRTPVTVAERRRRSGGRIAKGLDKVKALPKKSKPGERGKALKQAAKPPQKLAPKKDPVAAAEQAKVRESWKAQEQRASAAVKSQHGATVDERALARATDGQRWAARRTR